jgi:AraC-like DNA-binding protein
MSARESVLALLPSPELRSAVLANIGPEASVTVCRDLVTFDRRITMSSADLVVLELTGDVPADSALGIAMRAVPASRITCVCTLSPAGMRAAAAAARLGVARIAIYGHDDLAGYLRVPTREPNADDVQAWLATATRARASGPALDMLLLCLRAARREGTVAAAANALGVHRATLVRTFRDLGLPQPKAIISRYRVLLAVGLLERSARPIAAVCSELGFSSYVVFRRVLARHTPLRPSLLRDRGRFDELVRVLLDTMIPALAERRPAAESHELRKEAWA